MRTCGVLVGGGSWGEVRVASDIYTMEYYSAIRRNKIELFVVRWMDLESVIKSEVSQKEKNKCRMLMHIYGT